MKKLRFFLICLMLALFGSHLARANVSPVYIDGWVAAGNKTVGKSVRYMRIGLWDEAQKELRKIISYRPSNHAAQYNLGLCFEKNGQFDVARRLYEKAIELRPEYIYCEGLARMMGLSGTGVEFLKFMIPCDLSCNSGYVFAQAGLWAQAITRFETSINKAFSPVSALNLAVAYEVLGNRSDAERVLRRISSSLSDSRYDSFCEYIESSPDLSLDMLTSLPSLTTITNSPVLQTMFVSRNNAIVRQSANHDSPVMDLLLQNAQVDILDLSQFWVRVRTDRYKEGYLPGNLLSPQPVSKNSNYPYSNDYEDFTADNLVKNGIEKASEESAAPRYVHVLPNGRPVAVRSEPSLFAEITGYIEPGKSIPVFDCDDSHWLEVQDNGIKRYILKTYVVDETIQEE